MDVAHAVHETQAEAQARLWHEHVAGGVDDDGR